MYGFQQNNKKVYKETGKYEVWPKEKNQPTGIILEKDLEVDLHTKKDKNCLKMLKILKEGV